MIFQIQHLIATTGNFWHALGKLFREVLYEFVGNILIFLNEPNNLTWVQLYAARQRLGPADFLASQKPLQSGVSKGFVKHRVSQNPVRIFFENSNSALIPDRLTFVSTDTKKGS